MSDNGADILKGRTLYIHPMTRGGARLLAATFRSIGIDAKVLPPSDTETLKLGNIYSSGEECLPSKITMGDYLKVAETEDLEPKRTAFLMPTSNGPCRFGQYSQLLMMVLRKKGLGDIAVVSPSSKNGYAGIGGSKIFFFRTAWLGLVASDIIRKMQFKTRPYEKNKGTTDSVYERGLSHAENILEIKNVGFKERREMLVEALVKSRDEFRTIEADYLKDKPLIGILGEIFCRHNRFANEEMVRKLESYGAEAWIADVGEWVFYTNWSSVDKLRRWGKSFSIGMAVVKVINKVMKEDEHRLLAPFHEDFIGYEEPSGIEEIVRHGEPYLPAWGALGEMALSIGRAGYLHTKGVDGIVDINPFTCMNGIVSEAVYPSFSKDHNAIPCRVFYYDGTNLDLDRDIGIFMELVRGYMSRKTIERRYPRYFRNRK